MPIYAYKCGSCGHAKDVLQKISDAPLTVCPSCGAESFSKQVTAAGFQLKGSGWYVTDFRSGNTGAAPAADKADAGKAEPAKGEPAKTDSAKTEAAPAPAPSKTETPSASAGASSAGH
ncbi:MAG: putative regulatory protein FmdB family [Ramlibacter sp.]|jgi:putative FmdB family regulatory protein|nr:putative regulatory protein FmdB family [Ramlibacter sp.]